MVSKDQRFLLATQIYQNLNSYLRRTINYPRKYACNLYSETRRIQTDSHDSDNIFLLRQVQISVITQAHAWLNNLMYIVIVVRFKSFIIRSLIKMLSQGLT